MDESAFGERIKLLVVSGLILIVSLGLYAAIRFSADSHDSDANVKRLEEQIGRRIEQHQRDLDAKKGGASWARGRLM